MSLEIVGLIAILIFLGVLFYYYITKIRNERKIDFELLKAKDKILEPIESNWSIRILKPTNIIEKCKVFYDDIPLPWGKNTDDYMYIYEKYFGIGEGGNALIPKGIEKDDAIVVVKDGNKTLRKRKFKDLPEP
ncbi:MAG: hypothetical protein L6M37_00100 [Candidatus Methylarchaceae archaeon HK02M1]|nr:hypothetical protein [Candidatus Methylarchaceae archaeon HK02M1]